jgi:hypothetical protein
VPSPPPFCKLVPDSFREGDTGGFSLKFSPLEGEIRVRGITRSP